MVLASTRAGDWCLDPFAGSGTLGAVASALGRQFVLMDISEDAVRVARERLGHADPDVHTIGSALQAQASPSLF
jgi:site-specific DNA-methyltransferase (adenine-specific)